MRVVAHNGARIWGGAERATVTLLAGLKERGHTVTLLCNSDLVARNATARGVDAELCVVGGDIAVHHSVRLAMSLRRLAPDAFIVGTFKKLFLAGLGGRLGGVRRVVARVGLETDTPRSWKYRYALAHWIDAVAVNSRRMAAPFAALDGFGADNVALIWNGVEPNGIHGGSAQLREWLRIPGDRFVVGAVGRLARQKRFDRLIRAIALVPDVTCIIAGDGPRKPDLTALISDLGLTDRVFLLGHRDDTHTVLDALDAFAVSSDTEGLSNAMLEAMAHGLPVVSTSVSGADDALAPDGPDPAGIVTGFEADSLAAAIAALRDDAAKRKAMGDAARHRAAQKFSMETMLDEWEAFLAADSARR